MPSGPPELHEYWSNKDPNSPGADTNAERHLRKNGFVLTGGWEWIHPTYKHIDEISDEDYKAISYLIMEWDYGGFRLPTGPEEFTGLTR